MPNDRESPKGIELMRGTLDMLILRTLLRGAAYGHRVANDIRRATREVLKVEHGSLYPALHRLERRGLVVSTWEVPKDGKRGFKYYRLTPAGKKQLAAEHFKWRVLVASVDRVMECRRLLSGRPDDAARENGTGRIRVRARGETISSLG